MRKREIERLIGNNKQWKESILKFLEIWGVKYLSFFFLFDKEFLMGRKILRGTVIKNYDK